MSEIRRALLSVSDKEGLIPLAQALSDAGVEILSTGGTAKIISEAGIPVQRISDFTGFPEILNGRVKSLHPKVYGGLLAREKQVDQEECEQAGIAMIDLLVVNLYPFSAKVEEGADLDVCVEFIDIGGPAMLRAGAKNYERVHVLVDPSDYTDFLNKWKSDALSCHERLGWAQKAFAHTASYDRAIAARLESELLPSKPTSSATLPNKLSLDWEKISDLRYGENPHQLAAFYKELPGVLAQENRRPSIAEAKIVQGKPLSYNNILDLDAALNCCVEQGPRAAVIIKHTNACGVARSNKNIADSYRKARSCDPTSSFGGIVAVNEMVDEELATELCSTFLECVVAPGFSEAALRILAKKSRMRLLALPDWKLGEDDKGWTLRSVAGGLLLQAADFSQKNLENARVVSKRKPSSKELRAMDFAWRTVKHLKSNAIVFCSEEQSLAVGAGQMSRVDAAKIAIMKAQSSLAGSVVASDAFFPFRDGVDALANAGATAVIQPGGSVRDQEVIEAVDEHNMAMVFTGVRHFRH